MTGCTPEAVARYFTNPDITWDQIDSLATQVLSSAGDEQALANLCETLGLPKPGQMFAYG